MKLLESSPFVKNVTIVKVAELVTLEGRQGSAGVPARGRV
jgi:hypothetical protein